jgi:hypothetical protein
MSGQSTVMRLSSGAQLFSFTALLTIALCGCSGEPSAWEKASKESSESALTEYMVEYPEGAHTLQAQEALAAVHAEEERQRTEKRWAEALGENTTSAYEKFRSEYPGSVHDGKAQAGIEVLLYEQCMAEFDAVVCDRYLKFAAGGARSSEVSARRSAIVYSSDLEAAELAGTYEAYSDFILEHPEQTMFSLFDGGIGPFLKTRLDLEELCPADRPRLEEIAMAQGVEMGDVSAFPGFLVGVPPIVAQPTGGMPKLQDRELLDCYPIPQWSAKELGLYEVHVTNSEGRRSESSDFSVNANKVFSFIARDVGGKPHVIAAKLELVLKPKPESGEE